MRSVSFVCVVLAFVVLHTAVWAQQVSDEYCKQIEDVVATPYRPAHFYHKKVFADECWLAFDVDRKGGVGVRFRLVRYSSDREAKLELRSDIETYEGAHFMDHGVKKRFPRTSTNGFWSAACLDSEYGPMLLRRKSTFITLFCDERGLCDEIEARLRKSKLIS